MDSHTLYLRKHLVSPKLAQRLREVGVPQRSAFTWERRGGAWQAVFRTMPGSNGHSETSDGCSAFMASELGCLLPSEVAVYKLRIGRNWECAAIAHGEPKRAGLEPVRANTMPDALAKMLIQIVEQRTVDLRWMTAFHSQQ